MQERSRQLERQQSLRVEIEDTLTPRKATLAGSPSTTRSYLYRATRIEQNCNMLRPSSTSPSCVELRASCFNSHASEQRLIRQPQKARNLCRPLRTGGGETQPYLTCGS